MKRILLFATVLWMIAATNLWAATVSQVLTELEGNMSLVRTLQAKFYQEKELKVFKNKIHMQGSVSMEKPERFAWRGITPIRYAFVVEGDRIQQWDEPTNQKQSFSTANAPGLKFMVDRIQKWFYGDYRLMTEDYEVALISELPLTLRFIPKEDSPAVSMIRQLTVTFNAERNAIEQMVFDEANGDRSQITFTDRVLNETIDAEAWKVNS